MSARPKTVLGYLAALRIVHEIAAEHLPAMCEVAVAVAVAAAPNSERTEEGT